MLRGGTVFGTAPWVFHAVDPKPPGASWAGPTPSPPQSPTGSALPAPDLLGALGRRPGFSRGRPRTAVLPYGSDSSIDADGNSEIGARHGFRVGARSFRAENPDFFHFIHALMVSK